MESRRSATLGVSISFFVIASIFVALRFVSRVFVVRRVGWHDWLMLVAWVCRLPRAWSLHVLVETGLTTTQLIDFGFSFSLFYATENGLGLHSRDILPEQEGAFNRATYAFTVLYVSSNPVAARRNY